MKLREELGAVIYEARPAFCCPDHALHDESDELVLDDSLVVADAVLEWLGGIDPTADRELVALHLRDSGAEIGRLREERDRLVAGGAAAGTVAAARAFLTQVAEFGPAAAVRAMALLLAESGESTESDAQLVTLALLAVPMVDE